ncbi:MAG: hypothetical protein J6D17_04550 [Bacteroides sp.]|nr:hypothetical protein [Bacteroides sp.]
MENNDTVWLQWYDLTPEEKKQARESYITIRELEEEKARSTMVKKYGNDVASRRFQRMPDGYIYVDL